MLEQKNRLHPVVSFEWDQLPQAALAVDEAIVTSIIRQGKEWRVRFQSTYWHARPVKTNIQLRPEERVRVTGRQGLVLIVQPISE